MFLRALTGIAMAGAIAASGAAVAETVGQVRLVVVYGYETQPGAEREPIYVRDDVVANTALETVRDGRMDVRFVDDTQLIVGPSSTVVVDRFVFDPNQGAGDLTLNMGKGLMRFVSGSMASQNYRVRTPSATLGVRGTDFVVAVDEAGATRVSVLEGSVEMQSNDGDSGSVGPGATGATAGAGVSVAPTIGLPPLAVATFGIDDEPTSDDGDDESGSSGGD